MSLRKGHGASSSGSSQNTVTTYRMVDGAVVRVDTIENTGNALQSKSGTQTKPRVRSPGVSQRQNHRALPNTTTTFTAAASVTAERLPPRVASKSPPASRRQVVDRAAKTRYGHVPAVTAVDGYMSINPPTMTHPVTTVGGGQFLENTLLTQPITSQHTPTYAASTLSTVSSSILTTHATTSVAAVPIRHEPSPPPTAPPVVQIIPLRRSFHPTGYEVLMERQRHREYLSLVAPKVELRGPSLTLQADPNVSAIPPITTYEPVPAEVLTCQGTEYHDRSVIVTDEERERAVVVVMESEGFGEALHKSIQRAISSCILQEKYSRAFITEDEIEQRESIGIMRGHAHEHIVTKDVHSEEGRKRQIIIKEESAMFRLLLSARAQRAKGMSSSFTKRDVEIDVLQQAVQLALEIAWNHGATAATPQRPIPLEPADQKEFLEKYETRRGDSQSWKQTNRSSIPSPTLLFDCILSSVFEFCEFSRPHKANETNAALALRCQGREQPTRRQAFLHCEQFVCKQLRDVIMKSRQPPGYHMVTASNEVASETRLTSVSSANRTLHLDELLEYVMVVCLIDASGSLPQE